MATQLQEDLADAIVRNKMRPRDKRLNKGELVKSVGYSAKVADVRSTAIIEAKGVQKALSEKLERAGLTKELIENALVDDIMAKPEKRYSELNLGAEILGMKIKPNENQVQHVTNNLTQIIINAPSNAREARNQPDGQTVPSVAGASE